MSAPAFPGMGILGKIRGIRDHKMRPGVGARGLWSGVIGTLGHESYYQGALINMLVHWACFQPSVPNPGCELSAVGSYGVLERPLLYSPRWSR